MAVLSIPEENRQLTDPDEIRAFLQPYGIWYEKWDVAGRITPDANAEEILASYQPEIERLKEQGGYVTADVINVSPETPGLEAMCAKFAVEHTHSEDEVRFTVHGRGIFHIHPDQGPVFGVTVEAGDLINVPSGTKHWFHLCDDRTIRCIRLFEDPTGWTPHYVEEPINDRYAPLCFGNDYVTGEGPQIDPVVKL